MKYFLLKLIRSRKCTLAAILSIPSNFSHKWTILQTSARSFNMSALGLYLHPKHFSSQNINILRNNILLKKFCVFNSEQSSSAVKCQQSVGWLIMSSRLNGLTTSPLYPDYTSLSSINPLLGFWHRKCKVRAHWSIGNLIDSCHTHFLCVYLFLAVKYYDNCNAKSFFEFLENTSPFCVAIDTPVLYFLWRLPWVSEPGWMDPLCTFLPFYFLISILWAQNKQYYALFFTTDIPHF